MMTTRPIESCRAGGEQTIKSAGGLGGRRQVEHEIRATYMPLP